MSENEHGEDRMDGIAGKMQSLAMEGVAVATREMVTDLEDALDDGTRFDAYSFAVGGLFQGALRGPDMPKELPSASNAGRSSWAIAATPASRMPDPETAFDDLPVYEPPVVDQPKEVSD